MAKFERQWTAEQAADIINRHVAGESARSIGNRYGCAGTTISRLLRAPDIAPIVEETRAKRDSAADAAERQAEQDRARIERLERDRARKQAERDRARAVREGTPPERAAEMHPPPGQKTGPVKTPARKRGILAGPVMTFDTAPDGFKNWRVRGGGSGQFTYEDYLDRNDAPPVTLADEHPVTVRTPILTCGLRLGSADAYDKDDIVARVDDIAAELGLNRNEVIRRIYSTPPGGTCVFEFEEADDTTMSLAIPGAPR